MKTDGMIGIATPDTILDPLFVDQSYDHFIGMTRSATGNRREYINTHQRFTFYPPGVGESIMSQRHAMPHHPQLHFLGWDGFIHSHVLVAGQSLGCSALIPVTLQVCMVLAAGGVVLILDCKHGVGGVDGEGETEQDGQVALIVVERSCGVSGHRAINDKACSLRVLSCLLSLELLDDAEQSLVTRVASLET